METDESKAKKNFSGPTIIYCPTKKEVDNVANILNEHGVEVGKEKVFTTIRKKSVYIIFFCSHENIFKDILYSLAIISVNFN